MLQLRPPVGGEVSIQIWTKPRRDHPAVRPVAGSATPWRLALRLAMNTCDDECEPEGYGDADGGNTTFHDQLPNMTNAAICLYTTLEQSICPSGNYAFWALVPEDLRDACLITAHTLPEIDQD